MNLDYSPVIDESGKPGGVIAMVVETTERVLAQRHAAFEREHQRRLFTQMPGFVAVLKGPEHVYEYVNQAYLGIAGDREFVGKTRPRGASRTGGAGIFRIAGQGLSDGTLACGARHAGATDGESEDPLCRFCL